MATVEELVEQYQTDPALQKEVADILKDGKVSAAEFMSFAKWHGVKVSLADIPKYLEQAKQLQMASESYQLAMKLGLMQSYAAVGQEYFYDDGVFFVMNANGRYETIIPPAGALVEELPDDYEIVVLKDGKEYFKVDETIYRMTVSEGKAYFEVLGQLQDYNF